jgi:transposase
MDALAAAAAAAPAAAAPARQRLTEKERWLCVAWHEDGQSKTDIATKLGVSRNTVAEIIKREKLTGSPASGSRSGRPRATDEATDTAIAFTAHVDVFTTPRQVKRKLQLDISPSTIDRRLQEAGLFGRVARHKRDYGPAEIAARLDFAVRHKAGIAKQWLHNSGVNVLDFPPYSPDLNPIENLWSIMAREVEKTQCEDDESLGDVVLKVWSEVDPEVFRKLARSMPERCQAVIGSKGWHTRY